MTKLATRTVKEHEERRTELMDTAQELFYQKGYATTSITSIIDAVGIAKGTFYHYFQSKADLLDQIIERQMRSIDATIDPIVRDDQMGAVEKFNMLWSAVSQYKAGNKELMLMLAMVLYSDENIVLLNKLARNRIKTVAPRFAEIISQGVAEGVFDTDSPAYAAELIMQMGLHLGEEFGRMVREEDMGDESYRQYIERFRAYDEAVARILGAEEGLVCMIDTDVITRFFEE